MKQANKYGVSFDHFIKPLTKPDIVFHTDASLKIGIGAISNKDTTFNIPGQNLIFSNRLKKI